MRESESSILFFGVRKEPYGLRPVCRRWASSLAAYIWAGSSASPGSDHGRITGDGRITGTRIFSRGTGSRGHAYFLGGADAKQVGGGTSVRRLESQQNAKSVDGLLLNELNHPKRAIRNACATNQNGRCL